MALIGSKRFREMTQKVKTKEAIAEERGLSDCRRTHLGGQINRHWQEVDWPIYGTP
jgi:hypothetical protein